MSPRIPPLSLADADPQTRELLAALSTLRDDDTSVLNVFTTMANHPDLLRRWLGFANHVLLESTIPPRERELAILRAGWRCHSPYEWGQHVIVGRRAGITDEEVARVAAGPDAEGWSEHDAAILRATDELHDLATITDVTWATLARTYSTEQLMDLVFAIGQYHLVSFALNAFGVERDDGIAAGTVPFPDPAGEAVD
jgi:alkylhydroperoxidase family enzyme